MVPMKEIYNQVPSPEVVELINTHTLQIQTVYVMIIVLQDWTELPLVTPDQIKAARSIKYMFTGDLEKQVVTNPFFPGKEKNLLRA